MNAPNSNVRTVRRGAHAFQVIEHPATADAVRSFAGGFEEETLGFFDAVLPRCRQVIDGGGFVGLMSLYAAGFVPQVHTIEASPTHVGLLERNLAANPPLATRIRVHPCALGGRDGQATLFRKGSADSGASLLRSVERQGIVHGAPEATVPVRAAASLLRDLGIDAATLLKLDIEGAEYEVLPSLADLLAEARPFLQVSFHPFNIVRSCAWRTDLARLRAALAVAEACACYPYMYLRTPGETAWVRIDPPARPIFLRHFLLAPKPVERVATPQYGFTGAVGFSFETLPALDDPPA